jgi:hypothetical protein
MCPIFVGSVDNFGRIMLLLVLGKMFAYIQIPIMKYVFNNTYIFSRHIRNDSWNVCWRNARRIDPPGDGVWRFCKIIIKQNISIKVLIFCVEFWELSHLTRDLFQAEKKINVVTS